MVGWSIAEELMSGAIDEEDGTGSLALRKLDKREIVRSESQS